MNKPGRRQAAATTYDAQQRYPQMKSKKRDALTVDKSDHGLHT